MKSIIKGTPSTKNKVQNLRVLSFKEGGGHYRNLIFHTFNLGHFREEGLGSKSEFPNTVVNFIVQFLQKGVHFLNFPIILNTNIISRHKLVFC